MKTWIWRWGVIALTVGGCQSGLNLIDIDEDAGELQPIEPATTVIVRPLPAGSFGGTVGNPGPPLEAHDPAAMVEDGDYLVTYFSGLESISYNQRTREWETQVGDCGEDWCVLRGEERPVWIDSKLGPALDGSPLQVGSAPGMDGPRTLYYTVTDWNRDDGSACIGRATATGEFPELHWEDDGMPVLCSTANSVNQGDDTYAIDPAILNGFDGSKWLVYGSHYSGIYVVKLDPVTGHLLAPGGEDWTEAVGRIRVASNPIPEETGSPAAIATGTQGIEAAFIYPHNNRYYLFVNWGACCNGVDSTYSIRVGRADSPTGPYVDRDGNPLLNSGGTLLLESENHEIGPGHAGVFEKGGRFLFTYHYYNENNQGTGTLGYRELSWSADGWPELSNDPYLFY